MRSPPLRRSAHAATKVRPRERSRAWRQALRLAAALPLIAAALLAAPSLRAQDGGPAFPPLTGRVVDAANLLDERAERALSATLAAHEEASSDQVVVATVPSLEGYAIADYANRLGRAWGIGTAENDNGVVLLVAPNEREVRIEVGYGLEGALTDALSSTIIRREILPAFRSGDYTGGVEAGVDSILAAIEGEYTAPVPGGGTGGASGAGRAIDGALPLIFLALVAVPQLLRRGGARRAANGAFPAGFAGLVGALASGSVIVGAAVALGLFALIYFGGKGGGGGKGKRRRRRRMPGVIVGGGGFGGGGFGGGGFGGGGFGGGGGSFGGGGASGGW